MSYGTARPSSALALRLCSAACLLDACIDTRSAMKPVVAVAADEAVGTGSSAGGVLAAHGGHAVGAAARGQTVADQRSAKNVSIS